MGRYVAAKKAALDQCPRLAVAGSPQAESLREGTIIVHATNLNGTLFVPSALIHDWTGTAFIPHTSFPDVLDRLRCYKDYPRFFHPTVTSAKTLSIEGDSDRFSVTMRHEVLTIRTGLSGEYVSRYHELDPAHAFSFSSAVRLQEVSNPGSNHARTLDPGQGSDFIWRLFSQTRHERAGVVVYLELQAAALSRPVPRALAGPSTPSSKNSPAPPSPPLSAKPSRRFSKNPKPMPHSKKFPLAAVRSPSLHLSGYNRGIDYHSSCSPLLFARFSGKASCSVQGILHPNVLLDQASYERLSDVPVPTRPGSILSASLWMFFLSLLLFWLPVIGPLIAGFLGGRKAGTLGNAVIAAFLPGIIFGAGLFFLATLFGLPSLGVLAGAAGLLVAFAHIGPLVLGAILGALL